MEKESPFDIAVKPVKPVVKALKQEVSEQLASTATKAAAKLLRMSGKAPASSLAGTLDKISKRISRE